MKVAVARVTSIGVVTLTVALVGAVAPALTDAASAATPRVVASCARPTAPGQFACFAERRADLGFRAVHRTGAYTPATTPSGYGPTSLQSAYALPSATAGTGQRVYIVDAYDDPTAETDLGVYRSQYGLPACTTANGCFRKLNQTGTATPLPAANAGWAGEISLDLDMISAVCPNCAITLLEATDASTNLFVAVKEAATLGAKFVSLSWGSGEFSSETSVDSAYFQPTGIVYTVSTGDGAYAAGVSYPASSPDVVAVGGTSLAPSATTRGWSESAWKTSTTEGAGSGCSAYEPKPAWQSAVPSSVCARRADADISAVADPATGVAVYQGYGGGGWAVYGGTSASAPIVASAYALAGAPAATDIPASFPYTHTAALNDVTTGATGTCTPAALCTAGVGWDGPTGLGTPNGLIALTSASSGGTGGTGGSGGTGKSGSAGVITVANPGAQTGTVTTPTTLALSATDTDSGQALTWTASGLPAGLAIAASTGVISGTPTAVKTSTVTVTAADRTGGKGTATFTWTVAATAVCSGQKVVNPGIEGAAGWKTTSGVIASGPLAHSGTGYAWLDGYGKSHTDTLSQTISLPAGCHATLSYFLRITSQEGTAIAYDTLAVTANGSTVQSFSNRDQVAGYVQQTVDLSGYAGKPVVLSWTGREDYSLATSFLIDDVTVAIG